jgi:hypothetical protein
MYDNEDDIDERHQRLFNHYLEIGAIELAAVDDDGEFVYEVKEIAKEIAPELWEAHTAFIDKQLMSLYDAGLVEVEYDENLEPTFSISDEGMRVAKELGVYGIDKEGFENN